MCSEAEQKKPKRSVARSSPAPEPCSFHRGEGEAPKKIRSDKLKLSEHIFFTGFMGSGKSTHGRKLAKALGAEFIDLDTYITRKFDKTIQEIFDQKGEGFFRDQETECLKEILEEKKEPAVISLGGGAVCFNENITLVKNNGLVIYLETHENILRQRLMRSKNKRPLLKHMNDQEVLSFIKTKIKERATYYEQADIKINGLNLTTATLIKALEEHYKK